MKAGLTPMIVMATSAFQEIGIGPTSSQSRDSQSGGTDHNRKENRQKSQAMECGDNHQNKHGRIAQAVEKREKCNTEAGRRARPTFGT